VERTLLSVAFVFGFGLVFGFGFGSGLVLVLTCPRRRPQEATPVRALQQTGKGTTSVVPKAAKKQSGFSR